MSATSSESVSSVNRIENWIQSVAAKLATARWPTAMVGLLVLAAATWWVTNSALFDLRTIRVEGNDHLSRRQVVKLGGLTGDVNVLWTLPSTIERRLERHPWIKEAHVSRLLPSALSVIVVERRPLAVLPDSGIVLAPDGRVLGKERRTKALPVVSADGPTARSPSGALAVAKTLPRPLRKEVEHITVGGGGLIELLLRDGTRVIYGSRTEMRLKAAVLRAMLEWADKNQLATRTLDISVPTAPTLIPAEAQLPSS